MWHAKLGILTFARQQLGIPLTADMIDIVIVIVVVIAIVRPLFITIVKVHHPRALLDRCPVSRILRIVP